MFSGNSPFFRYLSDQDLTGNNLFFDYEGVSIVVYLHVPAFLRQLLKSCYMDTMVSHVIGVVVIVS